MAGKGKKKPKNGGGAGGGGEKKEKKKATKSTKRRSGGGRTKSARCNIDVFTEAAMENAYSTCHNVQDLLKYRGFPWPDAQQKKKKKGKK